MDGHELRLNVVSTDAHQGLGAYAGVETAGGSLDTTLPSITSRAFPLVRVAAELPVDTLLPSIYGSHKDLVQALLSLKVNAVRDVFKYLLIYGDTTTSGQFDGLGKLAGDYGNTMGADGNNANGGTVLAGEIEALLAMLNSRPTGGETYLVMHANAYKHLLKNNYSDAEYREHAVLGTVPVIAGMPVLFDHFIDDAENKGTSNDTTSIYAVTLGKDVGLCGLYPRADEGQPIQVRGPVVKESTGTMWYHVSWNVGLAAYDQCAVAQLNGVRHAQ